MRDDEEVIYEEDGFRCSLVEITWLKIINHGWGNGYVGVSVGHPLYGKTYWDDGVMGLDVHGGITFSEKDGIYWVFGFDTAHFQDTLERWPKDKVIKEVLKLMQQLKEMV